MFFYCPVSVCVCACMWSVLVCQLFLCSRPVSSPRDDQWCHLLLKPSASPCRILIIRHGVDHAPVHVCRHAHMCLCMFACTTDLFTPLVSTAGVRTITCRRADAGLDTTPWGLCGESLTYNTQIRVLLATPHHHNCAKVQDQWGWSSNTFSSLDETIPGRLIEWWDDLCAHCKCAQRFVDIS